MITARTAGRMAVAGLIGWLGFSMTHGREAFSEDEKEAGDHKLATFQLDQYAQEMKALQTLGFDIAGVDYRSKKVDLLVDHKELAYARNLLERDEIHLSAVTRGLAPDTGYHTHEEVADEMAEFAAAFPEIAHLESIGTSLEGREIWAIKISDNPSVRESDEPTVLFNSMHHAREVMTTEVAMDTIEHLLTGYGSDEHVTRWVERNEIWVVPMINPDGNHKVWHSDSMWRKNARDGYGVDLNRNYPFEWNGCGGSSGYRYSQTYRGPSPASEPETNALMNLVARIQPVVNISYHSYSEMVLYPYGCSGERSVNRAVVEGIGEDLAKLIPSDNNPDNHYVFGTPWELLYSVDGGDIDWMYHEYGVIPYVIELNSSRLGFQPSYSRWRQPTVEKLRAGWGFILDRMDGAGVRGRVMADQTLFEDVTIGVKGVGSTSDLEDQHLLKADGTYHIVLEPGTYELTFRLADREPITRVVELGDDRLNLDIEF